MLSTASRRPLWFSLLIAGLTFAVFAPVLRHAFLFWDDSVFILRNEDLNPPRADGLARIWGHPLAGYHQFYVPVTYTVWWMVAHVARAAGANGGPSVLIPMPFHALNLAFHIINAVLVFVILRRLIKSDWPAVLGALLFALHPLQADPVSWAANMYTSLSALFALLAVWGYLRYSDARAENVARKSAASVWFALATLCFTLALLTKPAIILLPFTIVAIEVLLRKRRFRECSALLAWVVLAMADALITRHVQTGSAAYQPALWQRPFVAADALSFYLYKTLLPFGLIPDYGRSPQYVLHRSAIAFTWILPAIALIACWICRRKFPWLLCGALVFVLGVFPMLGLLPFDYQKYSTNADRYLYFSLFGLALAIAFTADWLWKALQGRQSRFALFPACCAVMFTLATLCRTQVSYWEHTGTLFTHTLEVNPKSLAAHVVLGYVLMNRGGPEQMDEALAHFRAAAEVDPADPGIFYNTGIVLLRKGDAAGAVENFRQALRLKNDEPGIWFMLGRGYEAQGDRAAAIRVFTETARRYPNTGDTDLRLARLLAESGDRPRSLARYRAWLQAHPDSAEARAALAQKSPTGAQAATDPRE